MVKRHQDKLIVTWKQRFRLLLMLTFLKDRLFFQLI